MLFAFVQSPYLVSSFFRVPPIMVFLPDRWIIPVGRVFVGLRGLGTTGLMWLRTH